jgi:hypothetical protein
MDGTHAVVLAVLLGALLFAIARRRTYF